MTDDLRQRYHDVLADALGECVNCGSPTAAKCICGPYGTAAALERLTDAALATRDSELEQIKEIIMGVFVCVGCGQAEGHPESCDLGGYADREELAAERRAELVHERDHWLLDERAPGCEYCLIDPPSPGIRITRAGYRALDEAAERYRTRVTTLEQYDAERAAIIAAHPATEADRG
ncbi:hypothetical protein ACFOY2_05155 [Nonomuraea purpurea]|uniref:Uncharacterized protein n=1 Tax=Nonomuraea purpurea TaxID=1849276 RepID=A0ABV8FYR3_9ACTN